jgi:C_GCAxxG_C_C family probable redox protein
MDRELALKVSCGFGGGLSHTGGTCGAVAGAVMAISLKHGRGTLEDTAAKEKTYTLVEDFCRDFKAKHGSLLCTDLIGHDLSIPEELAIARERNAFEGVCPGLVKDAVEIVEKLL